jgi:hypothetical protein
MPKSNWKEYNCKVLVKGLSKDDGYFYIDPQQFGFGTNVLVYVQPFNGFYDFNY